MATYEPSDELRAAREAMEEAKTVAEGILEKATRRLHKAIAADAAVERNTIADIARFMGWSPNYVSRIARAEGVPARVDVEPPRRRKLVEEPELPLPPLERKPRPKRRLVEIDEPNPLKRNKPE